MQPDWDPTGRWNGPKLMSFFGLGIDTVGFLRVPSLFPLSTFPEPLVLWWQLGGIGCFVEEYKFEIEG